MNHRLLTTTVLAATLSLPAISESHGEFDGFQAALSGFNELPAILSEGTGTLSLRLDRASKTIKFRLTYSGLSTPVTQSHIHFGKVHTDGGVIVFFCTNLSGGPSGVQACPANGGTVTGTITAAGVLGVPTQNVTAGDFDALTDALISQTAYANVHTTKFPAGEIRGQIHSSGDDAD